MSETYFPAHVICRPAIERDLEDIQEFCRTIWDGHDYVPDVMDDWLHEPQGIFAVAEYEEHAIACSKITRLAGGQWWLEGFRVDPNHQGRKVGSLIHHYVDQWWLEHGEGMLRLMTSSKNKAVHHLCETTSYTKLFEVRGYKAEPLPGHANMFTSVASDATDLQPVIDFAAASPSLALTNHVVDFGWRCANPISAEALSHLVAGPSGIENHFFWWRKDQGLLILWDDFDPDEAEQMMGIGVLACKLEDMSALLRDIRYLAAAQRKTSVFWLAPVHEQVQAAFRGTGFSSDWDSTLYVFEKKHPRQI